MTEFFKRGGVILLFTTLVSCEIERQKVGGKWIESDSDKELTETNVVTEVVGSGASVETTALVNHVQPIDLKKHVVPFVENYCIDCHDSDNAKADRNFEAFLEKPFDPEFHLTVEEILDQLNLGEMPPKKKSVIQPEVEEVRSAIADMTEYLRVHRDSQHADEVVMRRLTNEEYRNSLRDLLGVHPDVDNATKELPQDERTDGFTNIGHAQKISRMQMDLYMETAMYYIDRALVFGKKKPVLKKTVYPAGSLPGVYRNPGTVSYVKKEKDNKWIDMGHGHPEAYNTPVFPLPMRRSRGVPFDGYYRISVDATAVNREHKYEKRFYNRIDLSTPLKLALWSTPNIAGLKALSGIDRRLVRTWEVPDNRKERFEEVVYLTKGSVPFVNWINGPTNIKGILRGVRAKHHPEIPARQQNNLSMKGHRVISEVYAGPAIRVFSLGVEGPLGVEWPPVGHRNIVGTAMKAEEVDVKKAILNLANLAFRQEVKPAEVAHYVAFVNNERKQGVSAEESLKLGLAAVLCSPRFLYIDEGDKKENERIQKYEIASRLSYALWASTPDEQLLQHARNGALGTAKVREKEIERLLNDPKSTAFTSRFIDAWLRLDKLGSMPPSLTQFPQFYNDRLQKAMRTETELFFQYVLDQNLPILTFINSDETFVNDQLAKHYKIPYRDKGSEFVKVKMPASANRPRGVVGHASVLTASANGVETSPVIRGIWILESILGTPPSPAPPDTPVIEPDTRGSKTIRQRLDKHRTARACRDCHAKIDPWGFALEAFDPIGSFRERYHEMRGTRKLGKGIPIDTAARLNTGTVLADYKDMTDELVKREQQVTENIIRKFLTYSTGREMTFLDQPEVKRIAAKVMNQKLGFRDCLKLCLSSDIFLTK